MEHGESHKQADPIIFSFSESQFFPTASQKHRAIAVHGALHESKNEITQYEI